MARFFTLWNTVQNLPAKQPDRVSKFLLETNETFKVVLTKYSWFIYFIAAVLIICSIHYYYYDYKCRLELRRRRQAVQRANERIPQRRRPGAISRDHEIFRNAMKTVRQYIGSSESKSQIPKSYILRQTRSGAIYGRFADDENTENH